MCKSMRTNMQTQVRTWKVKAENYFAKAELEPEVEVK